MARPPGAPAPAPPPPDAERCGSCGGGLYETEDTGQPQPEDHAPGCKLLRTALQAMQYAAELERAGKHRRYLRRDAEKLRAAACSGDPATKLKRLAERYAADARREPGRAEAYRMLSAACQALAEGTTPPPVSVVAASASAPMTAQSTHQAATRAPATGQHGPA
jgi:hypothetical protein